MVNQILLKHIFRHSTIVPNIILCLGLLTYEEGRDTSNPAEQERDEDAELAADAFQRHHDEHGGGDLHGHVEREVDVLVAGQRHRVNGEAIVHEGGGGPTPAAQQQAQQQHA